MYFKVKNVFDDTCSNSYNALLREDTAARKVYLYRFNIEFDGDSLLYDFSATEGQSLSHCLTFSQFDSSKISSIDSIFIDGNFRKRFNILFFIDGNSDSTFWIEGLGAVFGPSPFTAGPENFGYGVYTPQVNKSQVICYKENNVIIYERPYTIFNCYTGDVQINNYFENLIEIYPNPCIAGEKLSIINEKNIRYECEIISITVNMIYQFTITGNYQLNTNNLPQGYYYIIFKSQNIFLQGL